MKKQGFVMVESVLWLAALAVLAAIVLPNALKIRQNNRTKVCRLQLYDLRDQLFEYSRLNQGRYPVSLAELSPELPACPSHGEYVYRHQAEPDLYLVACQSEHLINSARTSVTLMVTNARGFEMRERE